MKVFDNVTFHTFNTYHVNGIMKVDYVIEIDGEKRQLEVDHRICNFENKYSFSWTLRDLDYKYITNYYSALPFTHHECTLRQPVIDEINAYHEKCFMLQKDDEKQYSHRFYWDKKLKAYTPKEEFTILDHVLSVCDVIGSNKGVEVLYTKNKKLFTVRVVQSCDYEGSVWHRTQDAFENGMLSKVIKNIKFSEDEETMINECVYRSGKDALYEIDAYTSGGFEYK